MDVVIQILPNGTLLILFYRDFLSGIHRDSYASHVGHFSRVAYLSVA